MKRAIEFEEVIKVRHQIIVEVGSEEELNTICGLSGDSFDDILLQIDNDTDAEVLESNEEYFVENEDGLGYYDDYWTDTEAERFFK